MAFGAKTPTTLIISISYSKMFYFFKKKANVMISIE